MFICVFNTLLCVHIHTLRLSISASPFFVCAPSTIIKKSETQNFFMNENFLKVQKNSQIDLINFGRLSIKKKNVPLFWGSECVTSFHFSIDENFFSTRETSKGHSPSDYKINIMWRWMMEATHNVLGQNLVLFFIRICFFTSIHAIDKFFALCTLKLDK